MSGRGNLWWGLAAVVVALWAPSVVAQETRAVVSMEAPQRHFLQLRVEYTGFTEPTLELVLPVWTPGSYKIRDYSQNMERFRVSDGSGNPLPWSKTMKNRWSIQRGDARVVVVEFDSFAYERSVRHSYLDDTQAFLMPGTFVPYAQGALGRPYLVEVRAPDGWVVDTALERVAPNLFRAVDYDRLVDCPLQVGTQEQHDFEADGTVFRLSLTGEHDLEVAPMLEDMRKVVSEAGAMFEGFPFERYVFLTRFGSGGGGLEHADSTALMSGGFRFDNKDGWRSFLSLVAHEFFHAWNVKRIRDRVLGPFDYTREVYTRMLWVHEGWTVYYAAVLLRRAGITSDDDLRKTYERLLSGYLARPGRKVQSLASASFDAWIKFYQTNQTTRNSTVSYYSHGQVAALCLDLILRHHSGNESCLDDVMRELEQRFAARGVGFEESDLFELLVRLGGDEAKSFWDRHIVGTDDIDFARYLAYAGLRWQEKEEKAPTEGETRKPWERREVPDLGFSTREDGRSLIVRSVVRGGTAWEAGLDLEDELIAIGRKRVTPGNWTSSLKAWGRDVLPLMIARHGRLIEVELPLRGSRAKFELKKAEDAEVDDLARAIYEGMFDAPFSGKVKEDEVASNPADGESR